jgi:hypothetical protein
VVADWLGCGAGLLAVADGVLAVADGVLAVADGVLAVADGVLAVADGVVVTTCHDVQESGTVAGHLSLTLADSTGNDVTLEHGGGRYASCEHLRPGPALPAWGPGAAGSGDRFARVHRRAPVGVAPPGGPGLLGLRSSLRQASASHCSNRCGDQPRSWTSRM